jgi:biopolymer transport protein ExbB
MRVLGKPFPTGCKESRRVLDLIIAGGPGMIPILICSVLVLGIVVERFWSLRRRVVIPPALGEEVRGWAAGRRLDGAHIEALERNSPLGEILAGALRARHLGREAVRERVEDVGRHVMFDLNRFLTTLGTLALISPLLGLLGTVIGLINMFLAILGHGVGDAQMMAGGIGEALVCTAAGMLVAVPAYIFHRYFRSRIASYGIAMEREVHALLDSLDEGGSAAPRRAAR